MKLLIVQFSLASSQSV